MPNALDLGTEVVPLEDVLPLGVIRRAAAADALGRRRCAQCPRVSQARGCHRTLVVPLQAMAIAELPRPRKGSGEAVPQPPGQSC
jgi:16S rRNA (cytidine1402-2'-O)-methyltransferase